MQPFNPKRRQTLLATGATLLMPQLASQNAFAADPRYGIVGQTAPELEVSEWIDGEGKPSLFTLSDHRGKFVLMKFWQAWCPGCMSRGFPSMQDINAVFKDSEFFVPVAIQTTFEGYSYNTASKMRDMQVRFQLPITMGHEAGDEETHRNPSTMRHYRSGGTPWLVLIDPNGKVLFNAFHINVESAIAYLDTEIKRLSA